MQYPTPQFIEEEGKIISFLTFKQFGFLVGGGFLCIMYYLTLPLMFFAALSLLTAIITFVIAFVKVNNMSVIKVLLSFIGFATKSKNYTWKKKEMAYPMKVHKQPEPAAAPGIVKAPMQIHASKLNSIKTRVDTKK